eukprot:3081544-Pyramimonas_sp.AAC.1
MRSSSMLSRGASQLLKSPKHPCKPRAFLTKTTSNKTSLNRTAVLQLKRWRGRRTLGSASAQAGLRALTGLKSPNVRAMQCAVTIQCSTL